MMSRTYSMQRFLASKASVDDRALNRGVLDALRAAVSARAGATLRVLELGAGLGNMVARLCDLQLLARAEYTLLDRDTDSLAAGREALRSWAAARAEVQESDHALQVRSPALDLSLRFVASELHEYLERTAPAHTYDLVIAHAVLDLVDVPALLPQLWRALTPGGHAWLTINFDGETILLPALPLDADVLRLYHRSMDRAVGVRGRRGSSRTGRELLEHIPASGGRIVSAGSSDWVVWPDAGTYPGDESYFLHHIVHTIDEELRTHPELDSAAFAQWVTTRHAQVEEGTLRYIAHQLDFLARAPA